MGILTNLIDPGYYVRLVLAFSMSVIPLSASAQLLLIWHILIGRKLLRLASGVTGVVQ